jgi:dolichol kinase
MINMTNWDIVAGLYNTTFTLFLFLIAFLMFFIAYKGFKAKNKYGGSSTVISGIIFIIFGYYNAIFWFLPYPYNGFMVWWIGIILGIYAVFAYLIKMVVRKIETEKIERKDPYSEGQKKPPLRRFVDLMTDENPYKDQISITMEAVRKSFHLAGLLFIFAYFWFLVPIPVTAHVNNGVITFITNNEWSYNLLWGDIHQQYPYTYGDFQAVIDLTLFALFATLVLAILADLIRVIWGPEYSIFNFLTRAVLRNKEYNAAGPQIYLVTGVIFSYLLYIMGLVDILVVTTAILVACFSDALAALIGRKYGKHKIKCIGGDIKSVEGFLAGAGSAFFFALIIIGPIYAIIVAIIFFILDYFPIIIADNILNPIAITIVIGISYALIGFPLGWF